jgi:hypothetical protein
MISPWYKFGGLIIVILVITSYIGCNFNSSTHTLIPKQICAGYDWLSKPENLERIEHFALDAIVEGRIGKFVYHEGVIRITDSPISFHLHGKWVIIKNPLSTIHGVGLKNGPCDDKKHVCDDATYRQIDVDSDTSVCLCTGKCLECLPDDERKHETNPFDSLRFLNNNFKFIHDLATCVPEGKLIAAAEVVEEGIEVVAKNVGKTVREVTEEHHDGIVIVPEFEREHHHHHRQTNKGDDDNETKNPVVDVNVIIPDVKADDINVIDVPVQVKSEL